MFFKKIGKQSSLNKLHNLFEILNVFKARRSTIERISYENMRKSYRQEKEILT